jgi:hypothetical protein
MKTLAKKYGTSATSISLVLCLLIGLFTFVPGLFPTLKAEAAMTNTQITSGVDYSGQGTKITETLRDGQATVSGDRVNVPTWTYGAYVYSSWDEFWAGWSSWSPNNKTYYDQKGYDYNGQHKIVVTDAERKTEYRYYRMNPDLNPQYRTRYYTEYKTVTKILFVSITTYSVSSSLSGYPGAISGKTISSQWTEREFSHNAGAYEYTGWQASAPSAWTGWPFYEPGWIVYQSQYTYRYKSCNLSWDAKWKNESSEQVPLKYSLYKKDGSSIGYGIKWSFASSISQDKGMSGLGSASTSWINQYYITSDEAKLLLIDSMEEIEDSVSKLGWLNLFATGGTLAVSQIISKAFPPADPVCLAVDIAILLAETSDYIMNELKAGKINSYQQLLNAAQRQNIVLAIQDYNYVLFYTDVAPGGYYFTNTKYIQSVKFATTTKTNISMKATDNVVFGAYLTGTKNYGIISYITDVDEIVKIIKFSLKYNYPTILPWNW